MADKPIFVQHYGSGAGMLAAGTLLFISDQPAWDIVISKEVLATMPIGLAWLLNAVISKLRRRPARESDK